MTFSIREAVPDDGDAMLALMPRLTDFDVPATRNPDDLWRDDAKLLRRWMEGDADCLVQVATDDENRVLGFTMVSLRQELLSHEPSAHLEVIVVSEAAQGGGIARALLESAERGASQHGARSMTLHVFANNARARQFYDRNGYDGELMRYIKHL